MLITCISIRFPQSLPCLFSSPNPLKKMKNHHIKIMNFHHNTLKYHHNIVKYHRNIMEYRNNITRCHHNVHAIKYHHNKFNQIRQLRRFISFEYLNSNCESSQKSDIHMPLHILLVVVNYPHILNMANRELSLQLSTCYTNSMFTVRLLGREQLQIMHSSCFMYYAINQFNYIFHKLLIYLCINYLFVSYVELANPNPILSINLLPLL